MAGWIVVLVPSPIHTSHLEAEGRVTFVDAILATSVLVGVSLNSLLGWWWADPIAGYVLVFYAAREARELLTADE